MGRRKGMPQRALKLQERPKEPIVFVGRTTSPRKQLETVVNNVKVRIVSPSDKRIVTQRKTMSKPQRENNNNNSQTSKPNSQTGKQTARNNEAKKELKCGICSDKFHDPKLLSCLHSFCSNCLRSIPTGDNAKSKPKIQQKQYCDQHEQEELRFYCIPCAKIICRDCKTLSHTVHQTMEINEVAESRKREIGKAVRHTKEYLPRIAAHTKTLNTMVKSLGGNTQETTKDIKAQAKKFHEEIDRMAAEMISEIKQKNKEMENTLQRNIKASEVVYASMESIILAAESFMTVGSDHDIIENSVNIKNRVENLPKEIPGESVEFIEFKFRPGPIPSTDLWSCFGNWTSDVAANVAISIPRQIGPAMALIVRELSSFAVLGGKAIISIAPAKEGNAWICNSLSEHIFLYTKSGQCRSQGNFIKLLLTEKDGLGEPWSVAVDSEGFLWVGDTEGIVKVYKYMS
ncbi:E3 ubiquitin-protein ligase TRIM71-like [Ruditapes philippinarum]|uniref:E3 ubiquitin-protein ligase TRIM71-like n=1 Tax=Ruditapes philippinarum TaxID=129788 RepID=UPI00295ADE81|nr:E3 ubiquitin-protein ligase TRIM71-like [Ruditapes philippinarum]